MKNFLKANKFFTIPLLFIIISILLEWGNLIILDEGVILNGAWKIFNNQKLYIDFFEYIGPGSFYLVWIFFLFFGPSYFIVKIFSIIFLLLSVLFVYKIFLLFSPRKENAVSASFIWIIAIGASYPIINHNTYSSYLSVFATYYFLLFIRSRKNVFLFLSGVFSATTFYFLQTKGFLLIIGSIIFFIYLYKNKKILMMEIFYYFLALAIIFILGIAVWGIQPFLNPFFIFSSYFEINKISYIFFSVAIFSIFALYSVFKKNDIRGDKILFLALLQAMLFLSTFNRPDAGHLLINAFPLIILLFLFLEKKFHENRAYNFLHNVIFIIIMILTTYRFILLVERTKENYFFITQLRQITKNDSMYMTPFMQGMYFYLHKDNPYWTDSVEAILSKEEYVERNFNILKREEPRFILQNYDVLEKFKYKKNIIDTYINSNYILSKEFSDGYKLLEKK